MTTLKEVLIRSYIAAIALGAILAQGLLSLAAIVLEPINRVAALASSRAFDSNFVSDPKMEIFDLPFSILQSTRAVLLIGSSVALAYWLFRPTVVSTRADDKGFDDSST